MGQASKISMRDSRIGNRGVKIGNRRQTEGRAGDRERWNGKKSYGWLMQPRDEKRLLTTAAPVPGQLFSP
jgi:hypothetical protein